MFRSLTFFVLGLLCACNSSDQAATELPPVEFLKAPMLTMDPNGITPLAGIIEFTTDLPTRVTLLASDGTDSWSATFSDLQTQHIVPVLGLKPNRAYTLQVVARDKNDKRVALAQAISVITDPLPADFPVIEVLVSRPQRMEPGFTMLDSISRGRGDSRDTWTMIVDNSGEVVWYSTIRGQTIRQNASGNLEYRSSTSMVEMDLTGNSQSVALQDPGDGLHHDLHPTEHGTLLSISNQAATTDNFPTSLTDPNAPRETAKIRDEPIVEFARDGSVLNVWSLADMLDPTRLTYDIFWAFTDFGWDWAHANAVVHDPKDDSIIVSLRHQEAVIKFSRATGQLKWILGPHQNWSPEFQPYLLDPIGSPFEWQFHQHAPAITPAGTLLLFDNGNYRALPFDGSTPIADADNYSRAVEFLVDEENMQVRQVWDYGRDDGERIYAHFIGDVDWLEQTGNVLVHFGGASFTDGVPHNDLGRGQISIRIVEVLHDSPAEKVFDLAIYNPEPGAQIRAYRSERIPSLYPPGVGFGR